MLSLSTPVEKNSCISLQIAWPIVVLFDWKKQSEKPSGLGALSGCMENKSSRISVQVGIEVRVVFISAVIQGGMASFTIDTVSSLEDGSDVVVKRFP